MNIITIRTETKDMKRGFTLMEQIPFMPERRLWIGIFEAFVKECEDNRWKLGKGKAERRAFLALGLSCKALHEIFLPLQIALCEREVFNAVQWLSCC